MYVGNDFKWKRVWIVLFLFLKPSQGRSLARSSHPIASNGTKSLHSVCAQWHLRETWTVLLSHFHSLPGWMHTLEVCGLSQDIRLPPSKTTLLQQATKGWQEGEGCSISAAFLRDLFRELHAAGNILPLLSSRVCTYTRSLMQQFHRCLSTQTHTLAYLGTTFLLSYSCICVEAEILLFDCMQLHLCKLQPALFYMHISAPVHVSSLLQTCMHGYRHVYTPCKDVAEFGGRDE